MHLYINGNNVLLIALTTFIISVLLTPIVRTISVKVGAVDIPDSKRKVHKVPIPTMGGLSIFLSFVIGYLIFGDKTKEILPIVIGALMIVGLGIWDDISPIKARYKLIGQIIAATFVVLFGNISFSSMQVFGHSIEFGFFAKPISIIFIVSIINAINLMDGLDGLAAGSSTIYFITIAIIGFIMNKLGGLDVILCLLLAGSCLGFLVYNFAPASIFMGDTGSMFLGYIISIIALLGFKTATITSLIIPILVLFVPIFDTILAMGRRIIHGRSVGSADGEHLHHQLLKNTKSTGKTVFIMYIINLLFAAVSIFYTLGNKKVSMVIYIMLLVFFVVLILNTDILFDRRKKK